MCWPHVSYEFAPLTIVTVNFLFNVPFEFAQCLYKKRDLTCNTHNE